MAVRVERIVRIAAPPAKVWAVMTDVERWPEWTPSIRSVKRGESGAFGMGSTATLEVAGAPTSVWTVTEFGEGQSFTWETTVRGVTVRAAHVIDTEGDGSRVMLTTVSTGLMARLFAPMLVIVGRRNLRQEAEGLKRRCEGSAIRRSLTPANR
jgi:carbon monoxide dehydrogenase subunit G